MLRVINLEAGYDRLRVISGISLHVATGEVVALLGNNGAGKSTLLRTIAGLITPREGRVLLRDINIAGWPVERIAALGVTLVPEDRGLFPDMTVHENLRMGGYVRKLRGKILREHIDRALAYFPALTARLSTRAGALSGGQQQMLAITRALVGAPALLILDEPSIGLAPLLVAEVFRQMVELKEAGMTLLLAEQNVQLALQLADRAYVLENGRITLTGTSAELMASDAIQYAYLGR